MSKILIVEDDKTLFDALKYNISREGYEAVTAVDGVQALETARVFAEPTMLRELPRLP